MQLNNPMRLGLLDRLTQRAEGDFSKVILTFWSGPVPTKTEMDAAFDALDLTVDSNPGRIFTGSLVSWLESRGSQELATIFLGSTNYNTLVDQNTYIYDASSQENDFDVHAEGTATFFTVKHIQTSSTTATWKTSSYDVSHLLLGSVGLPESDADHKISDTEITFAKTIKPGTIQISL